MTVPAIRVKAPNQAPVKADGDFVLYWIIACRRATWNFSLQRAVEWAQELQKPLVILEALRCGYQWASDRLHSFVREGMADNLRCLGGRGVFYYPYVEERPDAGKGLLYALAARACLVVTDDFPAFFLPRMVAAAARRLPVRLEQVDSNGLLPLRAADRVFASAYSYRRFLQEQLPRHLLEMPEPDPIEGVRLWHLPALPDDIARRWPRASEEMLSNLPQALDGLPIDHSVHVAAVQGGATAAGRTLRRFLDERLRRYAEERDKPEVDTTSGLSPYLHFGHMSVHQVFSEVAGQERWSPGHLAAKASGRRSGWWGMSRPAEAFLDQLVTWRELGFNMCSQRQDYGRYESLPAWSQDTLARHAQDPRRYLYSLEELEKGGTHDPLWNAAQSQLVREGRVQNYLRMLWGKKILEWTASPQQALQVMIELNNKYALDGRDPNSYSGIFWILGRYDRPWGPERPIFGKVRYMSSESAARRAGDYVQRHAP